MRRWTRLGVAFVVAAALAVVPASGLGPFAAPCASAAPAAGSSFVPLAPTRVLDTRSGPGPAGKLNPAASITLDVGNRVPVDATAVILNVTGVDATASTFVTAFPAGSARPNAANLTLVPNQTLSNLVTVGLGTGANARKITLYNNGGSVNLVADLAGYYAPGVQGAGFTPRSPLRALDTRTSTGGNQGTVGANRSIDLALGELIPPTATSVVMAVTATDVTATTYVTAWPTGQPRPTAATLTAAPGKSIANLATVSIGADQKVSFYNFGGSVNLVADVAGYFAPGTGGLFVPVTPTRILDTRDGTGGTRARVPANGTITVSAPGDVPSTANAAVVNVTGVSPTATTYVTASPNGLPRPLAANLLLAPNDVVPVLVSVGLQARKFDLYNFAGTVELVGDLAGYYVPRPSCGGQGPGAARYGTDPGSSDGSVPNGTAGRRGGGEQSQIEQREGAPNE